MRTKPLSSISRYTPFSAVSVHWRAPAWVPAKRFSTSSWSFRFMNLSPRWFVVQPAAESFQQSGQRLHVLGMACRQTLHLRVQPSVANVLPDEAEVVCTLAETLALTILQPRCVSQALSHC